MSPTAELESAAARPTVMTRLLSALATLRYLVRAVSARFGTGRCAEVAASLAFTTLLSLVPFITLVAVVLSKFPQSAQLDDALRNFLLNNLLPERAGKVIATYAMQFSQKATNLTIAGTLVLVITAVMLMRTIDQALNRIWMVRSPRAWAARLAGYWVALSFGPLLLASAVLIVSTLLSVSLDLIDQPLWLEAVGLRLISWMMLGGLLTVLYYAVPHCPVRVGDAALAGALTALIFLAMQRLFGVYLSHFPNYTLVYGAFAAVPIFLLWLYLSWMVVLLGAVLAAVLPERSVLCRPLAAFPGRRAYVALLLLAELARAQQHGAACAVDGLAAAARCGHGEARELLESLEDARFIARREDGGWLLAQSADSIRAAQVCRLFGWSLPRLGGVGCSGHEEPVARHWQQVVTALDAAAAFSVADLVDEKHDS